NSTKEDPAPKSPEKVPVESADKKRLAEYQRAFGPDGQPIGTSEIVIRDVATKKVVSTFKEHTGPIERLGFSPNAQLVVSTECWVKKIGYPTIVWEADTGKKRLKVEMGVTNVSANNRFLVCNDVNNRDFEGPNKKQAWKSPPLKILDLNDDCRELPV